MKLRRALNLLVAMLWCGGGPVATMADSTGTAVALPLLASGLGRDTGGPARMGGMTNGLVVYLNFDNNIQAQAGTTYNGALYTGGATSGPRYRTGIIGSATTFTNTATGRQPDDWAITLGNLEWVYSNSFSVSLWERTTKSGDDALIGNKDWSVGTNVGWVISSLDQKNLNYNAAGGARRDVDLNPPFSDGAWHLVTVTFDRAANRVTSYVDGLPVSTTDLSPGGNASLNGGFSTLIGSSGNGTYSATADIDDLGVWSRVLTAEEVAGIYGAGLNHRPLTVAVPGMPPMITAQPLNLSACEGSTARFAVKASGSEPLSYQWRCNGADVVGATNSSLELPAVTIASQGVYNVLVTDGRGAVVSGGAVLTVYELAVTGEWDFYRGDLRATVGKDLEYMGDTAAVTRFPIVNINGKAARIMAFGSNSIHQGFLMHHGGVANGGGHFVNQYTLVMDVMFPTAANGRWRALFQTDPSNHEGNDAELYIGSGAAVPDPNGIGAEGQFNGSLAAGTWYRVAFAVDLAAPAGKQLAKYANGIKVGEQSLSGGVDGRYALGPTALLFTAGMGGGGFTQAGFVSSIQFVNGRMSAEAIAALGGQGAGRYRASQLQPEIQVGQLPNSEQSLPSEQVLRAPGRQLQLGGRPVDLALAPDGRTVFIKNMSSLQVADAVTWSLLRTMNYPGDGASMHGIAVSPDGSHVYVTGAKGQLYDWAVSPDRAVGFSRTILLPAGSYPCGVAVSADGSKAYVCLSISNTLAVVDLSAGTVSRQIRVGIAPWDVVLSADGNTAYVSDWGGRPPANGELTAASAGTPVVIDARGVGASGTVSFVDLRVGRETAQVPTGLHPSALALSRDGSTLYVANANSDTVSAIDTSTKAVKESILVRPDLSFPYGSAADGLALSRDGRKLFVACGGNNAIGVVELPNARHGESLVQGYIPTDWYPGVVAVDSNYLYVANVKGLGSRAGQPATTSWQVYAFLGTANRIPLPDAEALSKLTAQAFEDGRVAQIKETQQPAMAGQPPVPVPVHVGEPSVFRHVLYILKENKTYDQMFGDMPEGNGNAGLCVYPQFVSPNHHALARQYVLLDNFYCNGVNSSDGHSWSTEGNNTDYLEKSFGGFTRSYSFGDDPLTYSSTGFIWNNVLRHGLSFRNYGEFDYASPVPTNATWLQIYKDFTNGTHSIHYAQNIGVASLRPYSSTNVPGWNVGIPDVVRADGFIRELKAAEAKGTWETFHLLYLPNDHTGGPPTPQAQVADNDLALGQVVEAVTKSSFGCNTVIFVIEDDPQSGYDHVDGHRSICLVISPYTKRSQVVSKFYNQAGVLHTMEQIMGLPPMNQQDAMAPLMFDCFTNVPDFAPYSALANNVDLTAGTTGSAKISSKQQYWARKLRKMDFSKPDRINEDTFNRYIWFTVKGDVPYPAKFVGGHGKGLKQLGLVLDKGRDED